VALPAYNTAMALYDTAKAARNTAISLCPGGFDRCALSIDRPIAQPGFVAVGQAVGTGSAEQPAPTMQRIAPWATDVTQMTQNQASLN
jgi:hypothetical protein